MTKEEFIIEKRSIGKQIAELQEKRTQLTVDFIEEHRIYSDGEKIRIVEDEHNHQWQEGKLIPKTERMAYVHSAEVNMQGGVKYNLKQAKKDGTMSSFSDYAYVSGYRHLEKF